jgi:hypothetical protein
MFDVQKTLTQSFRRLTEAQQSAMRLAESGAALALETSREVAKHNAAMAGELSSAAVEAASAWMASFRPEARDPASKPGSPAE